MTAEAIAKVVADLQARRAVSALGGDDVDRFAEHGEKENQYRLRADG